MLLYSLLHLAGVKAVDRGRRAAGRACGHARRHQAFPPARQQMPRPSGISPDHGRRDHDRPAGPGLRPQRRHGDRRALAGGALQPARTSTMFDYDVYAICGDGDMMEGVSSEAASLAGHLKLATSAGSTTTTTSPSKATPIWPSARMSPRASWPMAGTSMRVGDANDTRALRRSRSKPSSSTHDRADADHRRQPHRLRRAAQAGHRRRPRRAAGRGGSPRSPSAIYGWPEDAKFLVPDGVREHFAAGIGERGRASCTRSWTQTVRGLPRASIPSSPTSSTACRRRELPDGWDDDLPTFPADAKGMATRDCLGQGAQRASPRTIPGSSAARPTSRPRPRRA